MIFFEIMGIIAFVAIILVAILVALGSRFDISIDKNFWDVKSYEQGYKVGLKTAKQRIKRDKFVGEYKTYFEGYLKGFSEGIDELEKEDENEKIS